jgi:hypothetical protein
MKRVMMGAHVYRDMSAAEYAEHLKTLHQQPMQAKLVAVATKEGEYHRDFLQLSGKAAKRALTPLERTLETCKFWIRKRLPWLHSPLYQLMGDATEARYDKVDGVLRAANPVACAEFNLNPNANGKFNFKLFLKRFTDEGVEQLKATQGQLTDAIVEQKKLLLETFETKGNPGYMGLNFVKKLLPANVWDDVYAACKQTTKQLLNLAAKTV